MSCSISVGRNVRAENNHHHARARACGCSLKTVGTNPGLRQRVRSCDAHVGGLLMGQSNYKRKVAMARHIVMSGDGDMEITVEEDTMEKMEKTIESVQRNFGTVRTGRASASMLDRIQVDYYGAPTPLQQIANISTPEATLLVIQPYDVSAIPDIERAIQQSDVGLTPNNDGKLIRLQVPPLTAERRKEMTKITSKMGEDGKVAIRNVRRDAMKSIEKLEKDGSIGEDGKKDLESAIQKLTDEYIKQVDGLMKAKSDELTKV